MDICLLPVLPTVNRAAITLGVRYLLEVWLSGICPGVGLLGHTVALCLVLGNRHTVLHSGCTGLYVPIT